jgi:hypothetical protein
MSDQSSHERRRERIRRHAPPRLGPPLELRRRQDEARASDRDGADGVALYRQLVMHYARQRAAREAS